LRECPEFTKDYSVHSITKGGRIAKRARLDLENKTGKSVVTGDNFLLPAQPKKKIKGGSIKKNDR